MTSNCSFKLGRMHLRTLLERWAFLVIVSVLACNLFPTVGAQTKAQPILSEEEKREAQHLSVTFTRRLSQTVDMAVVMDELFLPDSVERYVATEKRKVSDSKLSYIVFSSGVFVDVSLIEKPVREDWRRFYIATSNFVLLGFIHAIRRNVDFEEIKPTDLYPPEVIELLDANPMLRNLIKMKSAPRNFKSFEEMHSATATLSQAVALMHKALPGEIDLEEAVIQMAMRKSGVKRPVDEKDLEGARAEFIKPQLEVADNEYFGFPKGTRMIYVPTFSLHELVLVKVDGKLRVVWAYPHPGE